MIEVLSAILAGLSLLVLVGVCGLGYVALRNSRDDAGAEREGSA